jgi:transposase
MSSKELEKRRRKAVESVVDSKATVASVAKRFKVNLRTLYYWLAEYRKSGVSGNGFIGFVRHHVFGSVGLSV